MNTPGVPGLGAILFDLHGTLMLDMDRFGPEQDYAVTFRRLGGRGMRDGDVKTVVDAVLTALSERYRDPAWQDRFPSVAEVIGEVLDLEPPLARLVEQVIAVHELGRLPASHADLVRHWAGRYRLGIISNLFSIKSLWLSAFEQAGISGCIASVTVSSDGPHIKPSLALFRTALGALKAEPASTLMVGDDHARDIVPAARLGLSTAWITASRAPADPEPSWRIRSLKELEGRLVRAQRPTTGSP